VDHIRITTKRNDRRETGMNEEQPRAQGSHQGYPITPEAVPSVRATLPPLLHLLLPITQNSNQQSSGVCAARHTENNHPKTHGSPLYHISSPLLPRPLPFPTSPLRQLSPPCCQSDASNSALPKIIETTPPLLSTLMCKRQPDSSPLRHQPRHRL
jgi:hypothetical protein